MLGHDLLDRLLVIAVVEEYTARYPELQEGSMQRVYNSNMAAVDDAIGIMKATLDEQATKFGNKTLIVFTQDNGGPGNMGTVTGSAAVDINHPALDLVLSERLLVVVLQPTTCRFGVQSLACSRAVYDRTPSCGDRACSLTPPPARSSRACIIWSTTMRRLRRSLVFRLMALDLLGSTSQMA